MRKPRCNYVSTEENMYVMMEKREILSEHKLLNSVADIFCFSHLPGNRHVWKHFGIAVNTLPLCNIQIGYIQST